MPSTRRCLWRYRFWAGVWDCPILHEVVDESQLITYLWYIYHQWLPDIELNQISAFSASYSRIDPSFTAGKQIGGLKLSHKWHNLERPRNDHLHMYSLVQTSDVLAKRFILWVTGCALML
jgi:hypothetical protein